jgi:hypothetical protein
MSNNSRVTMAFSLAFNLTTFYTAHPPPVPSNPPANRSAFPEWRYGSSLEYFFANSGYFNDFPIGNTPQTDLWW